MNATTAFLCVMTLSLVSITISIESKALRPQNQTGIWLLAEVSRGCYERRIPMRRYGRHQRASRNRYRCGPIGLRQLKSG